MPFCLREELIDMESVISEIVEGLLSALYIMKTTLFTFGGFTVSLFDCLFAALLIDVFLMVFLPFYDGGDDCD